MDQTTRNSACAPEIVPLDSTLQPYTEYSGPQVVFDKSQKEVALGDARLEMGVMEGKEVCGIGLEHENEADCIHRPFSVYRWYKMIRKAKNQGFTVRLLAWVAFIVFGIVLISILAKGSVANEEVRRPLTSNGTAEVNVTP